jgi:PAS domain S-box-containing protein
MVLLKKEPDIIKELREKEKLGFLQNSNQNTIKRLDGKDITQSKKTKGALKENEENFRNLAEYSPNMIFINKMGKVVYANKKCEEIMGYKREEFYAPDFDFLKLIAPESRELITKSFKSHLNHEEVDPYEYRLVSKDGKKIDAIITTKLIKFDEDTAILGIITVITEQKKTEEELRKAHKKVAKLNQELEQRVEARTAEVERLLKQKDRFIQQLSHDLKSPLTPLVALVPLLEKTEQDPKTEKLFKVLHRNIERLNNIAFKILELTELNSTDIDNLILEDINLWEEAENSINDQKFDYEEKRFKVENKINENIFVKADRVRLCEVFNNLITNAVKYSPFGSTVTIDACDEGDFVTVSIKDTGAGLSEEQLDYIFDEFYKADKSRHDFNSSGLGLSICKQIVEKHGGKIWAESLGIGKGSVFYFTVPIGHNKNKDYDSEGIKNEI